LTSNEHISVIINPVAGKGFSSGKMKELKKSLEKNYFRSDIHYTCKSPIDTEKFVKSELCSGSRHFLAVGGDGTVNMVARHLVHENASLGILPIGSGNGLARQLHIPLKFSKALDLINYHNIIEIDYGLINNTVFFCTAGLGFDAEIAYSFSQHKNRGLTTYLELILREIIKYKPQEYFVKYKDQTISAKAFMITFANAGQFGNNAYISPEAKIDDGFLDMCILSPFPRVLIPVLGMKVLTRQIDRSKYYKMIRLREAVLTRPAHELAHVDGEPIMMPETVKIKVVPSGLKVWAP
jgi:YegS/Rv2252/BmrU family lipid kinase